MPTCGGPSNRRRTPPVSPLDEIPALGSRGRRWKEERARSFGGMPVHMAADALAVWPVTAWSIREGSLGAISHYN